MSAEGDKKPVVPAPEPADLATLAGRCSRRRGLDGIGSGHLALALVDQVVGALPHGGGAFPELKQKAAVDALAGIAPRDPLEGMLAAQMLAVHDAAMECFCRAHLPEQTFEGRQANLGQANRLVRSYAALLEALDRHRGKGQPQVVRVERVTVEAGAQAIVGAVSQGGGGWGRKRRTIPCKGRTDGPRPCT